MTSSRIQALANELTASLRGVNGILGVYLFGSTLRTSLPADVDLVVVYGPPLTPATAPSVRNVIDSAVARVFDLPAHLTFFTQTEASQEKLLSDVKPELLYGPGLTGALGRDVDASS
jgi:predicted nucleotidyltransferase